MTAYSNTYAYRMRMNTNSIYFEDNDVKTSGFPLR